MPATLRTPDASSYGTEVRGFPTRFDHLSRSHVTTEWNSAFSLPLPTYSLVASENVVTFFPLASTRSSGSRVRRPVSRTLFIGPIPPGRPGLRVRPCVRAAGDSAGGAAGPDGRSVGPAVTRILAMLDHPARTRRCTGAYLRGDGPGGDAISWRPQPSVRAVGRGS